MAQTALIAIKCTKPRRRNALQRGSLYAGTAEKPYFMRFSGIEKVHRNSIKITVDLWQRTVILIETLKGGATSVQRGCILILGGCSIIGTTALIESPMRLGDCFLLNRLVSETPCNQRVQTFRPSSYFLWLWHILQHRGNNDLL